jgi:hypothetical protein
VRYGESWAQGVGCFHMPETRVPKVEVTTSSLGLGRSASCRRDLFFLPTHHHLSIHVSSIYQSCSPSDSALDNVYLLVQSLQILAPTAISCLTRKPTARNRVPPQHYHDALLTRNDPAKPTDLSKAHDPCHEHFAAVGASF